MTTDTTVTDAATLTAFSHAEAMALQAAELEATVAMLGSLSAEAWTAPTDCPAWDVREMYLHVLGACEGGASMREQAHQMRAAMRRRKAEGGPLEAALSAVQVDDRRELTAEELLARLADVAPRTVAGRRRLPGLVRRVRMAVDGPVVEKWTLGYLTDTIYLRDLWMHRVDACRATGTPMVLTTGHDGRIVADVVGEWARRHGRPFTLVLTGPAGGTFQGGDGAPDEPAVELDAVEFCRTLAGRAAGDGLLATIVPF